MSLISMGKETSHTGLKLTTLLVRLNPGDIEILDKYRGDLTRDAFMAVLLRMIDSGAVSQTPNQVKKRAS